MQYPDPTLSMQQPTEIILFSLLLPISISREGESMFKGLNLYILPMYSNILFEKVANSYSADKASVL